MARKFVAIVFLLCLATIGWAVQPSHAHGPKHNPARHQYVMHHGLPESYLELRNLLPPTSANLTEGERLYRENCALCHGETGQGDGEGALGLDPAPPSLTGIFDPSAPAMMETSSDGQMMSGREMMGGADMDAYTFWAVSEGGAPTGSAMPAYKDILTAEERWRILLYVANGFSAKTSQ
jgi:mono/diheme cytochrome c family protein